MRKKRTYGYVGEEKMPKSPERPRTVNTPKKTPKRPARKSAPHSAVPMWRKIIIGLLMIPLRILALIWTTIIGIWKRKPAIGAQNRKELGRMLMRLATYGVVFGFLFLLALFGWASKDLPDPDRLVDRQVEQSTKIYDKTGEHLLYEIFAEEKRTIVEFDDLPQDLIDGVIATEDTAFYEHKGIRPLSIMRSIVFGVFSDSRVGSGASTLTQQLVKNAILTNERKISRKLKEIVLSIRLEQVYTKDQILKIYFNEIPYGSTNYGVESAAQSYFGKSVKDLSLAESATLAGFPKAPTRYLNDTEALKTRRNFVLARMYAEGFISEEEKNAAQAEPLEIRQRFQNIEAPHFVLYVKEQLVQEFGEQKVETGGLKVITTLDYDLQQKAQEVVDEVGTEVLAEAGANNTALISMDPENAHILAMIGSKDFFDNDIDGQFNVATLGLRQPGSSFKPLVYAAAFEKGYTPETIVFDVLTNFAVTGDDYIPKNYDLVEHGPVSLRQALQGSLNISAVKAMYLLGPKAGSDFSGRMGYSTLEDAERFGLSLVLGGGEVRPLEHVAAYTIFANGGVKHEPTSILKVEDADGSILKEWKASRGERVIEKDLAHTMSTVLSDDNARAYAFGTGGILTLPGRPVAAKTGTTNSYIDAWTVGYTPQIVTGVWAGNTNNTPMTRGFGGSRVAGPIWNAYMRKAHEELPVEAFPEAPTNDAKKAALRGGAGGGITLKINKVTGKLATSSTPERYVVERTYTQPHSILHYVQKENPRGPVPENPGADQQYSVWEAAIQEWITRKQEEDPEWEISFEEPPVDEDDVYSLALIPELTVVYPAPSSTVYTRNIQTDIRVSAPRGVEKVSYYLNGKPVDVVREHPFNLNYYAKELEPGENTLTIVVEDDVGNRLSEDVIFTLDAAEEPASISWVRSQETIRRDALPHVTFIDPFKVEDLATISVQADGDERMTLLSDASFDELFQGRLPVSIDSIGRGRWTLTATAVRTDGTTVDSTMILNVE